MTRRLTTVEHAITVRQPYAQCIAIGAKRVENRGRFTAYRGPVAIHAGVVASAHGGRDPRVVAALLRDNRPMAFRAVIAVADLTDCHPAAYGGRPGRTCCGPWGEALHNDRPAFHLVLDRIVFLAEPVHARGMLSVPWKLPDGVAARVVQGLIDQAVAARVTR